MKRKKRRKLDSCRAVDRGLDPPSTRAAMKPSNSMRVAFNSALSRSSSQRANAVKIGAIGGEGVGRQAALHPYGVEESLQGGIRRFAGSRYPLRPRCVYKPSV